MKEKNWLTFYQILAFEAGVPFWSFLHLAEFVDVADEINALAKQAHSQLIGEAETVACLNCDDAVIEATNVQFNQQVSLLVKGKEALLFEQFEQLHVAIGELYTDDESLGFFGQLYHSQTLLQYFTVQEFEALKLLIYQRMADLGHFIDEIVKVSLVQPSPYDATLEKFYMFEGATYGCFRLATGYFTIRDFWALVKQSVTPEQFEELQRLKKEGDEKQTVEERNWLKFYRILAFEGGIPFWPFIRLGEFVDVADAINALAKQAHSQLIGEAETVEYLNYDDTTIEATNTQFNQRVRLLVKGREALLFEQFEQLHLALELYTGEDSYGFFCDMYHSKIVLQSMNTDELEAFKSLIYNRMMFPEDYYDAYVEVSYAEPSAYDATLEAFYILEGATHDSFETALAYFTKQDFWAFLKLSLSAKQFEELQQLKDEYKV